MYVDYDFYLNIYAGEVDEILFAKLELQASTIVNYYTFNRIPDLTIITDDIKLAVCELIDYLSEEERVKSNKEIQSESVGSHSVTYAISKNRNKNSTIVKKEQKEIVYKYLAHTNLLYRGGYYIY